MARRVTDLVLSVLATLVAFGLSWPFWRQFGYWAESRPMWWIYFVVGYVLALYVFYAFIGSLHTLFRHDALMRETAAKRETSDAPDRVSKGPESAP